MWPKIVFVLVRCATFSKCITCLFCLRIIESVLDVRTFFVLLHCSSHDFDNTTYQVVQFYVGQQYVFLDGLLTEMKHRGRK